MIGDLALDANPILASLQERYQGVIIMHTDPFEALVVTILSQNRTGEAVRKVYPRLDARCGGVSPQALAGLPPAELRELIRPAGPYKAPRLAEAAARVLAEGEDAFRAQILGVPRPAAQAYLESFPGVAHKTAACVLVFSAATTSTLPVDTHLFRVVDRLGLAHHNGTNNKTTREALISDLLGSGPDLAPAHFLFLLLGRDACAKAAPSCGACFLVLRS
jgi:endonuclease III